MWINPLPESFKREIINAHHRLSQPIAASSIDLLGYNISFKGEHHFRYLFYDVFIEASYFFKADNDRPLIFDCGSNIGMSILFFKKLYPNARIVAFEPDPVTFDTLRHNVNRNKLSDVALHQIAIGNYTGTIELFRDPSPDSSSLLMSTLRQRHAGPSVTVPVRCLSEFIHEEIDLLKIDVEGSEVAVMDDLANSGKIRQAKRLHLEYHHHIDTSVDNLSDMLRLIEENGFGYQLRANMQPDQTWPSEASFQDVSIYCYRKRAGR